MSNEIKKIEQPQVQWPALKDTEQLKAALVPAVLRQELRKVDTPMKAYQSAAPTLASIAKEQGEKFCRARLCEMLLSLETYLGSQCDMTKDQYMMLAEDLMDSFYALNVADVNLVLRKIMHGECGKVYGKVTPAFIYQAFADYYGERTCAVADSHINAEESIKKHGYDTSENSATEQEVYNMYIAYRDAYLAEKQRRELADLQNKIHLKELLKSFENERDKHNT